MIGAPNGIVYSSDLPNIKTAFNMTASMILLIDDFGFYQKNTGLLFGLQLSSSVAKVAFSLEKLYTLLGMQAVTFLNPNVALSVVTGGDSVNGLWICPANDYSLWYRKTSQGETDSAYLILNIPGFRFLEIKIIPTKEAYLQRTAEQGAKAKNYMNTSGDICISTQIQLDSTVGTLKGLNWDTYMTLSNTRASLTLRWPGTSGSDPMCALFERLKSSDGPNIDVGNSWTQFENIFKDLGLHLSRSVHISGVLQQRMDFLRILHNV